MIKDIEDIKRIVAEKNPKSIDELKAQVEDSVRSLPHIRENQEKIAKARGNVLEVAINIECAIDEIIILTAQPDKVRARFKDKVNFLKELMGSIDSDKKSFSEDFFKRMDTFVRIRNLFAHIPTVKFSKELEFDISEKYRKSFGDRPDLCDVNKAFNEALDIAKEILPSIVSFIKLVQEEIDKNKEFMKIIFELLKGLEEGKE